MLKGAAARSESGIAPLHLPFFQQVADRQDLFIMVRNVNKLCTSLIEHSYPTKGMSVHGKSSDWGPQAGLICVNQELSKYQGKARVAALNEEVVHSLGVHGKGDVEATPLILPKWRLEELETLKLVSTKNRFENIGHSKYRKVVEITCPERPHSFIGRAIDAKNADFAIDVYINKIGNGEPVLVIRRKKSLTGIELTEEEKTLPLTADYDLFSICPNFKVLDLAREDRFANARADLPEIGHFAANFGVGGRHRAEAPQNLGSEAVNYGSFKGANNKWVFVEQKYSAGKAHAVRGHISMRQEFVRGQLNALINTKYRGGDTVHHGAETMNPFPEADDFGITIFAPQGESLGLQNIGDLNKFYEFCRVSGYYMHVNPLWGWKPWRDFASGNKMNVASSTWGRR